ncbi:MAG: nucleoside deaminase [Bacteroidales bacterium]
MKRLFVVVAIIINSFLLSAQQGIELNTTRQDNFFITRSREELVAKLVEMPYGIKSDDPVPVMIQKMETFIKNYEPQAQYPDDSYARESNLEAVKSLMEGGYGIGAILIDQNGKVIARNHNRQIQSRRSDLHGEMALLTQFEESRASKKYMNLYVYKPGMTVFSSAEPCPMCFIRLSTAGVNTKFCTPGPDDGMVSRISCLPTYWQELAGKNKFELANSSPIMQKTAHLLFYSYYLDNRGPK